MKTFRRSFRDARCQKSVTQNYSKPVDTDAQR